MEGSDELGAGASVSGRPNKVRDSVSDEEP